MSIQKEYLKKKPLCKVTFRLPAERMENARTVHVVGEFNGWDPSATPMMRSKTGEFKATLNLELGREYQFRYLVDESVWENDWEADRYVPNPFGNSENCVVAV